jgi:hypothetical protein
MALTARDYMSRIGRTPEQQKYFDASGNVNSKYSSVASQQNPKPIYSFTPKTAKKGGGFTYGNTVNVYKKDKPVAAAPAKETKTEPTVEQAAPPEVNNVYQNQIDDLNKQLGDRPDFTVELARIQQDYQSQIAAQAAQQQKYLSDLQIQQDTRMNQMAAEQKAAAERLATGQRTYQQNEARASQIGALQIGGAAETPRAGGTQGFKRRKLQINPATANALSGILGGSAAATKTNTLNV